MALILDVSKIKDIAIVRCRGRIVFGEEADELRRVILGLLNETQRIVLHLRWIEHIDSSGVGTLVASFISARNRRAEIKFAALSPKVRQVLRATNVDRFFEVYDSSEEAVKLSDSLSACTELHAVYRRLIKMMLGELKVIEEHTVELNQELATLLRPHQDAVERLAEVPGLGVDSAQQILAEVGANAVVFASDKNLCSWVGVCPGDEESAGESSSHRSPQGNRQMRRLLNQAANAAVKTKGSIFEIMYRRLVPRLGHNQTIGAVAHRLCRLIWLLLRKGVRYEERGPAVSQRSRQNRTSKMIRELRTLGYRVEFLNAVPSNPMP
jgi:anti-anti-sigma factor